MPKRRMYEFIDYYNAEGRQACIDVLIGTGRSPATASRYTDLMVATWVTERAASPRPGYAYLDAFQAAIADQFPGTQFDTVQPQSLYEFRGGFDGILDAIQYVSDIGAPDYVVIIFGEVDYEVWVLASARDTGGVAPEPRPPLTATIWGDAPDEFEP